MEWATPPHGDGEALRPDRVTFKERDIVENIVVVNEQAVGRRHELKVLRGEPPIQRRVAIGCIRADLPADFEQYHHGERVRRRILRALPGTGWYDPPILGDFEACHWQTDWLKVAFSAAVIDGDLRAERLPGEPLRHKYELTVRFHPRRTSEPPGEKFVLLLDDLAILSNDKWTDIEDRLKALLPKEVRSPR
jgi:hypothetical protein